MSGTFSSLSTALSALRYNRAAMDVASGNVANAGTEGYSRRTMVAQSAGATHVQALWSRREGAGPGGVHGTVVRMHDALLDARSRGERAAQSYLDTRAEALTRVETGIAEPSDHGVAAALALFKQGWHDVANNPADGPARSQLLARAGSLTDAVNAQARVFTDEWAHQRGGLAAVATEVNDTAAELVKVNKNLRVMTDPAADGGTLLDQRDLLTRRLAELTGGLTRLNPNGTADVLVAGRTLVGPEGAATFVVSGAQTLDSAGSDPVELRIAGAQVPLDQVGGRAGGAAELLTGTLPTRLQHLDAVARTLSEAVNAQHARGYDQDGRPGAPFFTGTTAATIRVAVTDHRALAAANAPGTIDGSNATAMAGTDMGADRYRSFITGFGAHIASTLRATDNQAVLTAQVDASREALSGVNLDEEMVSLLAAQRGYEGAARVMTAIDSMLDTLINRTGLVR